MFRPRYADAVTYIYFPVDKVGRTRRGWPSPHQEAQIKPLRGFDRLASAGFSDEDILNIRRQFHSRSVADYLSTAEFPTEEECASAFFVFRFFFPTPFFIPANTTTAPSYPPCR